MQLTVYPYIKRKRGRPTKADVTQPYLDVKKIDTVFMLRLDYGNFLLNSDQFSIHSRDLESVNFRLNQYEINWLFFDEYKTILFEGGKNKCKAFRIAGDKYALFKPDQILRGDI